MSAVNLGAGRLATTRRLQRSLYQRLHQSDSRWLRAVLAEWSDPRARGGMLLLLNTAITSVLGLVYWLIAARLFRKLSRLERVGVACGPPAYLASCLGRSR